MEKLQRPKKVTVDTVRSAIRKLKRRKGITDDNINITMIAKEVGCSRQYLYKDEFSEVLGKYKKSEQTDTNITATRGSKEYHIEISRKKDKIIKELNRKLSMALDGAVKEEILQDTINTKKKEIITLKEQESAEIAQLKEMVAKKDLEIKWLKDLNARLREQGDI